MQSLFVVVIVTILVVSSAGFQFSPHIKPSFQLSSSTSSSTSSTSSSTSSTPSSIGQYLLGSGTFTPDTPLSKPTLLSYENEGDTAQLVPPIPRTFLQRFYLNDQYWSNTTDPIFLSIGGEGPISPSYGFLLKEAQRHNALLISLEHRFYGQSVPDGGVRNENMRFLTVNNALRDISEFILYLKNKINDMNECPVSGVCDRNVWLTFGGSYSGALSAWFREAYPSLTQGSHASSAVVTAVYNFTMFDTHNAQVIGTTCANEWRRLITTIQSSITSHNISHVASLLSAPNLTWIPDLGYMTADGAVMMVQYGQKHILCDWFIKNLNVSGDDLVKSYGQLLLQVWGSEFNSGCYYDSECLRLGGLAGSVATDSFARSWRWQKCRDVAYFQVATDDGLRLRSVNLDYHHQQCAYIFNGTAPDMPFVEALNKQYGGTIAHGSNIFFSNFSDDPWMGASIVDEGRLRGEGMTTHLVECDGCGHCSDWSVAKEGEATALSDERLKLTEFIDGLVRKGK